MNKNRGLGGRHDSRLPENPMGQQGYGDYFDKGFLKPEYVDTWADQLAILFGAENLSKHQMRAFFSELRRLQTVWRQTRANPNRNFAPIRNKLLGMKAQAHLREQRRSVPRSFREFIERNVDKAADEKGLEAFAQHFEAVAAYCEGRLKEGGGR